MKKSRDVITFEVAPSQASYIIAELRWIAEWKERHGTNGQDDENIAVELLRQLNEQLYPLREC